MDLNATQAAIRCGYTKRSAHVTASRLLSNAKIAAEVRRRQAEQLNGAGLTSGRVLEEIRRLALSDVRVLFDEDGNLRRIVDLTDEQAAAIASVEVVIKNAAAGDGVTDTIYKVKSWDKLKALEMAAKRLGLLTEQVEVSGNVTVSWQAPT